MKLKLLTLIAVLFTTGSLVAQDLEELLKRDFDAERRTIIAESIRIPDGMETEFWKIYSDMEQEMDLLTDKRIVNLKRYANNYENITDDIADDLANTFLDIHMERFKVYKKYYKKMGKIMSKKEAARLFQIINHIKSKASNNSKLIIFL